MRVIAALFAVSAVLLSACNDDPDFASAGSAAPLPVTASFDPAGGVLPSSNNLLYSGSMDATINIPIPDPMDPSAGPRIAINSLDGFSTIAPATTTFSAAVDPASVSAASVRMFEVTLGNTPAMPVGGPVTGIVRELEFGVDFVAQLANAAGTTLAIVPLKALAGGSHYMVALTNALLDATGEPLRTSLTYLGAKSRTPSTNPQLEPLRQLVNAQETALAGAGVDPTGVVLSWVYSTQSIGVTLGALRAQVQAGAAPAATLTATPSMTPGGAATIHVGTLDLPYYLDVAASVNDPAPLTSFWESPVAVGGENNITGLNPVPAPKSTRTVPLLASVPTAGAAPWPVVIYQHGITTNRKTLLAVADALAAAGFAAVAIDMPLHGLTDAADPLFMVGMERTFDLDLVNNMTSAPGPDLMTDSSGTHFIQLPSLRTSRDNLRQAVADLLVLRKAVETLDFDAANAGPDFDNNNVHFLGHSLGGMVGTPFLAVEPTVGASALAMSGGGIAKLLAGSASFGPVIANGLAASGIMQGTAEFEAFLGAAQTLSDDGDPLNYATGAATGRGLLMVEIVGDGGTNPPDQTVPNNVLNPVNQAPSPTAGTDPLAAAMGLSQISTTTMGTDQLALVRMTAGGHSSLLTDAPSAAVFAEIQSIIATFLATDGGTVMITDGNVIQ